MIDDAGLSGFIDREVLQADTGDVTPLDAAPEPFSVPPDPKVFPPSGGAGVLRAEAFAEIDALDTREKLRRFT